MPSSFQELLHPVEGYEVLRLLSANGEQMQYRKAASEPFERVVQRERAFSAPLMRWPNSAAEVRGRLTATTTHEACESTEKRSAEHYAQYQTASVVATGSQATGRRSTARRSRQCTPEL